MNEGKGNEMSKKMVRLLTQVQCDDRRFQVAGLRACLSYVSCSTLQLGEIVPDRAMVTSRYGQQTAGVILPRTSADYTNRLEEIELLSRIPGQSCASWLAIL